MEDLINALMGGGDEQGGGAQGGADPLADLLGGMLGGGSGSGSAGAGGLLEGLLGAGTEGQAGTAGGMGDLLGAILGGAGASSSTGQHSFLEPVVDALAEKIGISPEIASVVVTFLLGKLMSGITGSGAPGALDSSDAPATHDDLELDHLLTAMRAGEPMDADLIETSGMSEELAEQTGLDPETATASLQEAFSLLGGQMGRVDEPTAPAEPDLDGLSNLLDTW